MYIQIGLAALAVLVCVLAVAVAALFPGLIVLVDPGNPYESGAKASHTTGLVSNASLETQTRVIFTPQECEDIVRKLKSHEDRWENQSVGGVMRTFGRASYLGAANENSKSKGVSNGEMLSLFPGVYASLTRELQTRFPDSDIVLGGGDEAPLAGVPGFHIFEATRAFRWPVASLHVDRQYINAGFVKRGENYPKRTMSFTVLIQEPEGGAGLHIWDVSSEADLPSEGGAYPPKGGTILPLPVWLLANAKEHHRRVNYEIGKLVMHDGHHYHLIAPNSAEASRARITLQGHGIWRRKEGSDRDTLYVYW